MDVVKELNKNDIARMKNTDYSPSVPPPQPPEEVTKLELVIVGGLLLSALALYKIFVMDRLHKIVQPKMMQGRRRKQR